MNTKHPLFRPVIFGGGLLFGFGLAFSHMAQPEVILSFLQFRDFGLVLVMLAAALLAGIIFRIGIKALKRAPLTGESYALRSELLNKNLLIGGAIFGVGWGLSGVCPGAGYASLGIGNFPILISLAGMFLGAYLYGAFESARVKRSPEVVTEQGQPMPRASEGCG